MPWPPAAPTIDARPVEHVLAEHSDLLRRLRMCYGDAARFDTLVMPVVRRYAAYVHDLPATPDAHFSTPGGLLRLGLEVGFFCLQGCDSRILQSGSSLQERHALEPRWRLATLIAGLCCELHRVPAQMTVHSPQGLPWSCHLEPLSEWLARQTVPTYSIQWRTPTHPLIPWGVFVIRHIADSRTMAYLGTDNDDIVAALLGSVGHLADHRNVIDDLVRRSLAVVVDQDVIRYFSVHGIERRGSHVMRFVVDAIRRLVASQPKWRANEPGSVLAWRHEGLYLLWPQAGKSLVNLWAKEPAPGMPKDTHGLLRHLVHTALVTPPPTGEFWSITMPQTGEIRPALKVTDPYWLLPCLRDVAVIDPASDAMDAEEDLEPGKDTVELPPLTSLAGPWRLVAPLRLPELLKVGVSKLIASLNGSQEQAEVARIDQGIFVPLEALEQCGTSSGTAVRQLKEVDMLVGSDSDAIQEMMFRGKHVAGVVIDLRHVHGAA